MDKVVQSPIVIGKFTVGTKEVLAEFGCSMPIRFLNSDSGTTTLMPEKEEKIGV